MEIPGIPESIPRTRYLELIATLGLDVKELRRLEFKADGIYAEVFALNEDGKRYTVDGQTSATHHVCIPIADTADAGHETTGGT